MFLRGHLKSTNAGFLQGKFLSKRHKGLDLGHQERDWAYLRSPGQGSLSQRCPGCLGSRPTLFPPIPGVLPRLCPPTFWISSSLPVSTSTHPLGRLDPRQTHISTTRS